MAGTECDWVSVAATYIGIPIFLLIWLGYRVARKTRFVSYAEMQFPALPARGDAVPARTVAPAIGE